MTCKSSWLETQMTPVSHTLVPKPYQEGDYIVALFLQPDKNTGCVQSAAVGQNHGTFRHDEGPSVRQVKKLWSGSRETEGGNYTS